MEKYLNDPEMKQRELPENNCFCFVYFLDKIQSIEGQLIGCWFLCCKEIALECVSEDLL